MDKVLQLKKRIARKCLSRGDKLIETGYSKRDQLSPYQAIVGGAILLDKAAQLTASPAGGVNVNVGFRTIILTRAPEVLAEEQNRLIVAPVTVSPEKTAPTIAQDARTAGDPTSMTTPAEHEAKKDTGQDTP